MARSQSHKVRTTCQANIQTTTSKFRFPSNSYKYYQHGYIYPEKMASAPSGTLPERWTGKAHPEKMAGAPSGAQGKKKRREEFPVATPGSPFVAKPGSMATGHRDLAFLASWHGLKWPWPRLLAFWPFSFKTGGPLKWIRKTPADRPTGRPIEKSSFCLFLASWLGTSGSC